MAGEQSIGKGVRSGIAALGILTVAAAFLFISAAQAEPIQGAGSTFAAPIIAKWANAYEVARADGGDFFTLDFTVDYEPVGSLAGLMRLKQPELDFAATDVPVSPGDLDRSGQVQFPIVMGGVAVVANLAGIEAGALHLSGPVLADIYLGKITAWNDPAIVALNSELALPELPIKVLHRQDGSGSTFVFTEFLSATSEEWKTRLGADTLIPWPVGGGVEGTGNLLRAVQATEGTIAYAEYGQVLRAKLPFAAIENQAGNFALPDPKGVAAAASGIDWTVIPDFSTSLTDLPGADAYPLSTATFAVVQISGRDPVRYRRVRDLFRLALTQGAADATALGYVPLPQNLVDQIETYWAAELPGED